MFEDRRLHSFEKSVFLITPRRYSFLAWLASFGRRDRFKLIAIVVLTDVRNTYVVCCSEFQCVAGAAGCEGDPYVCVVHISQNTYVCATHTLPRNWEIKHTATHYIALWLATNGSILYILVLTGSESTITDITRYRLSGLKETSQKLKFKTVSNILYYWFLPSPPDWNLH